MKGLSLFFVLLWSIGTVTATVMVKESIPSLSRHSTVIVIGKITELKTVINNGEPWTVATVIPEKFLNGTASSGPLYFRIPGGQQMVGGRLLITEVDGAPRLKTLQKAVFFLSGKPPEFFQLVGLNQGYRPIQIQNGAEFVFSSAEESEEASLPLNDFVRQVKDSLRK